MLSVQNHLKTKEDEVSVIAGVCAKSAVAAIALSGPANRQSCNQKQNKCSHTL